MIAHFLGSWRHSGFGPLCQTGDKVGCGLRYNPGGSGGATSATLFFVRNGQELQETVQLDSLPANGGFYPAVTMAGGGQEVAITRQVHKRAIEAMTLKVPFLMGSKILFSFAYAGLEAFPFLHNFKVIFFNTN